MRVDTIAVVARIFQRGEGGKARERSDRVGRECGRGGVPPHTVEKLFFFCVCVCVCVCAYYVMGEGRLWV